MNKNRSWGGRFTEGTHAATTAYTQSQSFDRALYRQDISASKAHAAMLARQGIIPPDDARVIIKGLDRVMEEIATGVFVWKPELEDVHMNVEARLIELVG
ncbi:MAG: argininosuccinate lyase, partial [Desulfovibrio sp.]|nr:argininosuccinate lyase [Desulfovibrio sp.]